MQIDAQVISDFRGYYPEFADNTEWPDDQVTRYLQEADDETGSSRWGGYKASPASFKARGLYAYAAHRAMIRRAVQTAAQNGQTPASMQTVTSKSVGDESVQYATHTPESGTRQDQLGDLMTTIYGQEFLRLRNRAGTGAATTGQVRL